MVISHSFLLRMTMFETKEEKNKKHNLFTEKLAVYEIM
jgi:hypothetical protein